MSSSGGQGPSRRVRSNTTSSDEESTQSPPLPVVPIYPPDNNAQFMKMVKMACEDLLCDDVEDMYLALRENEGSSSKRKHKGKRKEINRGRAEGDARLWNDYFAPEPVYDDVYFRRRFRMRRTLFLKIVGDLSSNYPFFTQRKDAIGRAGLSPIQKCTSAIRQLAYGVGAETDEYVRIGESTALDCLRKFCKYVIELYSDEYLRRPTEMDIKRLFHEHETRHSFPGMLGSIACMHWPWKNCPTAWQGNYTWGDQGCPTIMLEAVASCDLWIWHAFFGVAGSNNDINVLNQSTLFDNVLEGFAPPCNFTVNGVEYNQGYYLADGIYLEWSTIVKSFKYPQDEKLKLFKQKHESVRKDVERAFGVLQSRWHIIRGPARIWSMRVITDIMHACIILHNMIVEDEGYAVSDWSNDDDEELPPPNPGPTRDYNARLERVWNLHNSEAHHMLRHNLVEHIWSHTDHEI